MTMTNNKLDNDTVRRLSKLISGSKSSNNSTPIMTGTVVQNDNSLYVAVDDDTLVPISDTNSNVSVGDTVTLALDDNKALIVGNITDTNATTSEVKQTNVKVAKAQATAEGAEKVATNYIDIDENKGITVGNMQSDTLGHNTYIDANGVSIRDGETVLASFEDDEIALGKNSAQASISLINNSAQFWTNAYGETELSGKHGLSFFVGSNTSNPPYEYLRLSSHDVGFGKISAKIPNSIKNNLAIKMYDNCIYLGKTKDMGEEVSGVVISCSEDSEKLSAPEIFQNNQKVSVEGHTHTSSDFETTLYSSDSGTTSTVTLSESAANFTYLEIYYKVINSAFGSVKVYSPNGKKVELRGTGWVIGTSTSQTNFETVTISGTKITRGTMGYWQTVGTAINTGTTSTTQIGITRVVGIK